VNLTTRVHLSPMSRMSGAITLLPHIPSRRSQIQLYLYFPKLFPSHNVWICISTLKFKWFSTIHRGKSNVPDPSPPPMLGVAPVTQSAVVTDRAPDNRSVYRRRIYLHMNVKMFSYAQREFLTIQTDCQPIAVAVRSKAYVCSCCIPGIAVSNPTEVMGFRLLWLFCVV
jgi:hypothetical protein